MYVCVYACSYRVLVPPKDLVYVTAWLVQAVRLARGKMADDPGFLSPVLRLLQFPDEPGQDAIRVRLEIVRIVQPKVLIM